TDVSSVYRAAGAAAFERHLNTVDAEPFGDLGAVANRLVGFRGDVEEPAAREAIGVIMPLRPTLVAGRASSFGDTTCEPDSHQRVEHLVDGFLADVRMMRDHPPVHLSGSRMAVVGAQHREHCKPLARSE